MRLGTVKRIAKEDMVKLGEVPKWIDPMLDTLNDFIEKVTTALSGNLTFADNFLCKEHYQDFTHAVAYKINPRLEGKTQLAVNGVLVLDANGVGVDSTKWAKLSDGNIEVTLGFSTSTTAKCRILILLR